MGQRVATRALWPAELGLVIRINLAAPVNSVSQTMHVKKRAKWTMGEPARRLMELSRNQLMHLKNIHWIGSRQRVHCFTVIQAMPLNELVGA